MNLYAPHPTGARLHADLVSAAARVQREGKVVMHTTLAAHNVARQAFRDWQLQRVQAFLRTLRGQSR